VGYRSQAYVHSCFTVAATLSRVYASAVVSRLSQSLRERARLDRILARLDGPLLRHGLSVALEQKKELVGHGGQRHVVRSSATVHSRVEWPTKRSTILAFRISA